MKTNIIAMLSITTLASIALAGVQKPDLYCVQSDARHIVIKPNESIVEVKRWGNVEQVEKIVGTSVRYLESIPPKLQTKYNLGRGYEITVVFPTNSNKGTGYLTINGVKSVDYYHCSK